MCIIYLDYGGRTANQMQTHFSVLSYLAHTTRKPRILVVTDHTAAYQRLADCVETLEVTPEMLQKWRGEKNYSFRIKIKAVQYAVEQLMKDADPPASVMFMDSDTFAIGNWDALYDDVEAGMAYMQKNEGMPYLTHGPSQRLWNDVKGKRYVGITMDEKAEMWNSGVIGMPISKASAVCELTLRLCDEMLADGVRSFNVEQFCFSLALRHHCQEIHSAEPYMCHYWGNKEGWNLLQGSFFTRSLMEQHTLEEDMQLIRELDVSSVPYYVRSPIWRKRFLKWIDHIAPLKNLQYLKKTKD